MSKKKLRRKLTILAGSPANFKAVKDENEIPTFSMTAYTGGVMNISGWYLPVVVDIAGVNLGRKNQPILKDHDTAQIVGHATEVSKDENSIMVAGICSGAGSSRQEVVESSSNGFPWQSSIGLEVHRVIELEEGKNLTVNGIEFTGPLYVARKSKLNEVSFVALGADEDTSATVAAEAAQDLEISMEEIPMTDAEKAKIEAQNKIDDAEKAKIEAGKIEAAKVEADEKEKLEAAKLQAAGTDAAVLAVRKEQARIDEVKAACKNYPEVEAKAIAEGLSVVEAKAQILDVIEARDNSNIGASFVNTGAGSAEVDTNVLTAAACMSTGAIKAAKLEDHFDEKTLDAANKMRSLGLKGLMEACARSEGKYISASMASDSELIEASFSTVTLPNMLSNLAVKSLVDAFNELPSAAAMLSEPLTASTFHEYTGVKLGGLGLMERVQNGGQIKSGSMDEETFNYQVQTVGKLIGLTREMLVNDDLGGFTRIAANLGKSAYKTRENSFWSLVLGNASAFFSAANLNLLDDALDIDGLTAGEQLLVEQTGIDGTPININAQYLVVPPALATTARGLYYSPNLQGGTTTEPEINVFQNAYEPIVTPYLSNTTVNASASDTGWYLFSNSNKPYGIAYLNGNQTPVIEEVSLQAGYLGRVWQGYFDYGVCEVEHRGAVFSSGDGS